MPVELVDDPQRFLDATNEYLRARAAHANLVLTIAHERVRYPVPGRYAWAHERGRVTGVALQSPMTFRAVLGPATRRGAQVLARVLADVAPGLPGVVGEAGSAAAFAGEWATLTRARVAPESAERLYRVTRPRPAPVVGGELRELRASEIAGMVSWIEHFHEETGARAPQWDLAAELEMLVRHRSIWCWDRVDEGGPCALTSASAIVEGVARVRNVYTPPQRRRRGYAAACVAGVTATLMARGAGSCVLFTQLTNPTSNALYQRLGYRPVAEMLGYRFDR